VEDQDQTDLRPVASKLNKEEATSPPPFCLEVGPLSRLQGLEHSSSPPASPAAKRIWAPENASTDVFGSFIIVIVLLQGRLRHINDRANAP